LVKEIEGMNFIALEINKELTLENKFNK
jgi:hypothetical protein